MAKKKPELKAEPKTEPKYKPVAGEICSFTNGESSFLGSVENGEVTEHYVNGGCQVTRPRGKASDYTASEASRDDLASLRRI